MPPDNGRPAAKAGCFRVLVRHFFGRFLDNESLSPQADAAANLGPILGLLATPGAFLIILLQTLVLRGWGLVTFRYFFVAFSFVVMALLVVLKWEALFPDRRDYQILTPLPLRPTAVFLAKLSALGIIVLLFLSVTNVFGVLLWPGIDMGKDTLTIVATHFIVVAAAGLYGAMAAAAVQGVLITVFSGSVFRRISAILQTLLMTVLVMGLFLIPAMGHAVQWMAARDHPLLYWFPAFWFIGLYEILRPATGNAVLLGLGGIAIQAMVGTALVFLMTYVPAYRWHARKFLEAPAATPKGPGALRRAAGALLNRFIVRTPVERAVFYFISRTLARSMKHRLFLTGYGGFGAALAVLGLLDGGPGLLQFPLTLSFILVSGLRAAFNFPSELRANWAFQLSETSSSRDYLSAMRKWIAVCAVLPLFVLLLPLELRYFTLPAALFHFVFGIGLSLLLIEIMFADFRKVPFTCAYFPGKMNLVGLSVLYVLGFTMYSRTMSGVEAWLQTRPIYAAGFMAAVAAALVAAASWRVRRLERGAKLDYEGDGDPVVRTLSLESHTG